ncbi:MAG: hypothetical protein AAF772_08100 [Acidobacteriota bacterium]
MLETRRDPRGRTGRLRLTLTLALLAAALALPAAAADVAPCNANADWLALGHVPPADIGSDGNGPGTPVAQQTNCAFYQFSWQWFLSLAQPANPQEEEPRRWETLPLYTGAANACDSIAETSTHDGAGIFVRGQKANADTFQPTVPESIGQAGGQDVLYAQMTDVQAENDFVNVVFYIVRYNRTECEATAKGFLPGTMELKTSWKQVTDDEAARYYTIQASVDSVSPDPIQLGLVGFHLVRSTATHPEFVWATFEHRDNVPDCVDPQPTPATGWAFTSSEGAECLARQPKMSSCLAQMKFNTPTATASTAKLSDTPQEICRVYRNGTEPEATSNNVENNANIDRLNAQLVGPEGLLTQLSDDHPLAVFKNYVNVGAIWTNDGMASTDASNLRGSLVLTNATMETFHQGTFTVENGKIERAPDANVPHCFSCHVYDPTKGSAYTTELSHIWSTIQPKGWPNNTASATASTDDAAPRAAATRRATTPATPSHVLAPIPAHDKR